MVIGVTTIVDSNRGALEAHDDQGNTESWSHTGKGGPGVHKSQMYASITHSKYIYVYIMVLYYYITTILSYIISYYLISYYIVSYYIISYYIVLNYIISY